MKKLHKFTLHYDRALKFAIQNLSKVNTLSSQVAEIISSSSGKFYVLLPTISDLEKIHNFNSGKIVSSCDSEISFFVTDYLQKNNFFCMFDDVNISSADKISRPFFLQHCIFHESEVYYTIKREDLSRETFMKCMTASNGIWHSLCVITTIELDGKVGTTLDSQSLKEICLKAKLIMIGAYDGEGYIFWEKT